MKNQYSKTILLLAFLLGSVAIFSRVVGQFPSLIGTRTDTAKHKTHAAKNQSHAALAMAALVDCGETFLDAGGAGGNYANNQNTVTTICPDNPGEYVELTFTSFDLEIGNDYLSVFNGAIVGSYNFVNLTGNTLPPVLAANNPSGCLTFQFVSNSSIVGAGWEASVECATCPRINNLTVQGISSNSIRVAYMHDGQLSVNSYDFEVGLPGFVPGTGQAVSTGNSLGYDGIVGGLQAATQYELYARIQCLGGEYGGFSAPFPFTTAPSCGDQFFDTGGPDGDFNPLGENWVTICPDQPGTFASVDFTEFDVQSAQLSVYFGEPNNYVYSNNFDNNNKPAQLTSTSPTGCISFFLQGYGPQYSMGSGWAANINCVNCPEPAGFVFSNLASNSVTLNWSTFSFATVYQWEVGLTGFDPGTGAAVQSGGSSSDLEHIMGLENGTQYDAYVRALCSNNQFGAWRKVSFTTSPSCGDQFFDSGGLNDDFQTTENYNTTICPDAPGTYARLDFESFNIGSYGTLNIFDANNSWDGWLGSFNGTQNPGVVTATNATGCLTVHFYTHTQPAPGWVASVSCVNCPEPRNLTASSPTLSGVNLNWNPVSAAQYYYFEVVPDGMSPGTGAEVASGNVFTTNTYVIGLESGTRYKAYVRVVCSDTENSEFSAAANFSTTPTCGDQFYDTGGPNGNYDPVVNGTVAVSVTTICPEQPGTYAQVVFTEFDIEFFNTQLQVYDGNNTWGWPFVHLTGNQIPSPVTSTTQDGCLTFYFSSGDNDPNPGWVANINCVTCPNPRIQSANPLSANTAELQWQNAPPNTDFYWEIGPVGFTPGNGESLSSGNTTQFSAIAFGLESNTDYEFYVKANCGNPDESVFSGPARVHTNPTCDDVFVDPGGPNGNFSPFASGVTVICPDQIGQFVELDFTEFDLGTCCANLDIIDGMSTSNGIHIGSYAGTNTPGIVSATNNTGCLTVFANLNGDPGSGWLANVECVTCPIPNGLRAQDVSGGIAIIEWNQVSSADAYEWELGALGFIPGQGESLQQGTVSATSLNLSGLDGATKYEVYLRTVCAPGSASVNWQKLVFETYPTCGDVFTDKGGPNGNYLANENYSARICPTSPGEYATLSFEEFSIDPCCASLYIYNGITSYSFNNNQPPPNKIYAYTANGCIDVSFYNGSNSTLEGWVANVGCVTCPPPTNFINYNPPTNQSISVQWIDDNIGDSHYWEIGPKGFIPGTGQSIQNGNILGVTTLEITGLSSQTTYDLYVRSNCQIGTSEFSERFPVTTTPTCGDKFYDPAGPDSSYVSGNLYVVTAICPDEPGTVVEVTFESLNIHPWEDYVYVYDGSSTSFPQITSFNGMTMPLPGPFTATNSTGCLTFYLAANASGSWEGWEANINCITCPRVSNLTVNLSNSVQLTWNELVSATEYEWEIGLSGFEPGTGNAVTFGTSQTNTVSITNLDGGTSYEAYVRAKCQSGEIGEFGNKVEFNTTPSCGDKFYDQGGPLNNYQSYQSYVTTICPQGNNQHVTATFNSFQTESCCDYLYIHDGETVNHPILGQISGSPSVPFEYTSTAQSGCLTFSFYGYYNGAGWEADITCDGCIVPLDFSVEDISSNGVNLTWESVGDANTYNYEIGNKGFTPGIGLATIVGNTANNNINLGGLQAGKEYDAYVRSICIGGQIGNFAGPLSFVTPVSCGSISYDSGGSNDDYGPNEDIYTLICSEVSGSSVWLEFQEFETQQCCDKLEILDGNTALAPSLGTFAGNSSPGIVTASNDSGCLMLHFTSDATVHRSGWKALVQCTTPTSEVGQQGNLLEVSPNPAKDWLNVKLPDEKGGKLQVVDVAGRVKWQGHLDNGTTRTTVPLTGLPAGNYFLRWQSAVVRFVVEP